MPLLEKDLPTIQENDGTCLTATLPGYVQRLGGTKNKQKLFLKSQNVWEKCYPGAPDPDIRMAATKLREWEQH